MPNPTSPTRSSRLEYAVTVELTFDYILSNIKSTDALVVGMHDKCRRQ
jgi:hypothetical protein